MCENARTVENRYLQTLTQGKHEFRSDGMFELAFETL